MDEKPYARMLDKRVAPNDAAIRRHLGEDAAERLAAFEHFLDGSYTLARELRFPFGNRYGWGYKYAHGRAHLCYAFFERDAFTITIQIGDTRVDVMEQALDEMTPNARALWEKRYPCGDHGGWMHYRVTDDAALNDVCAMVRVKLQPAGR